MLSNTLLNLDVYKMGHMFQYPEGTTKIYSYLCARSTKKYDYCLFFGLSYYIQEYLLRPITDANIDEFMSIREGILGPDTMGTRAKLEALRDLGYWPIRIEAVPEGTIVDNKNVLATFENMHPDFPWVVGFLETLFMKLWNTCTVATSSLLYRNIAEYFMKMSSDIGPLLVPFMVHDFGDRGCSSEETAMLSGMGHLLSFFGTDTVPAVWAARKYYAATDPVGLSVPATEHSVMCAYGETNELETYRTLLNLYHDAPILSIVSDTWNLWNVLTVIAIELKDLIMSRPGKVVFRPDGGNPKYIITGDPTAKPGSPESAGVIQILWEEFGGTVNSKGYKVLDPHVGCIYGEGFTKETYYDTLETLTDQGFSAENLIIGVGGLLLQRHTRDDMGFALKAVYAEVNGEHRDLMKNPVTSPDKKSHQGRLRLVHDASGYQTLPRLSDDESSGLQTYYVDGQRPFQPTFAAIRDLVSEQRRGLYGY